MFGILLINPWSLMFGIKPDNITEHSSQVVIPTHLLTVIKNNNFHGNINTDNILIIIMYHETR
ncbi:MAG TPA: hypothetical protein DIS98_07495 [Colwellia sp.]|nr:hypothetical protein [Colwellia sp.]